MKKHFDDTKIGRAISLVTDIIYAGILWFLLSLPLVTIGASSTALYYVTVKSIRHERGSLSKSFFSAFKSNFIPSLKLWLLYIAYSLIFVANNYALDIMGDNASAFMSMLVKLMFIPALLPLPWFFAYISRFENTTRDSIRYVYYICVRNIGRTLSLIALLLLTVCVSWLMPLIFPMLPGVLCLFMSYIIEPVFKSITEESEDNNPDKWYNE